MPSRSTGLPQGNRRSRRLARRLGVGLPALTLALVAPATTAWASSSSSSSSTWTVSTHGQDGSDCGSTSHPCRTIGYAVGHADAGDRVVVRAGTYHEQVVLSKRLTLSGRHATVDASGLSTGSGMTMNAAAVLVAPTAGWSTVEGLTVRGAIGEGILVMGASHVQVRHNVVTHNDLGTPQTTSYLECQAQGEVPGDCGEGVHLMSATDSRVEENTVYDNSGGVLVTDEFGPATRNEVEDNTIRDNLYDCGITLPSHNPNALSATGVRQPDKGGVYGNEIEHNTVLRNGTKGDGAGILVAAAAPGMAAYGNTIVDNDIEGNGMAGVTMHSHAPNQDISDNVVAGNWIGRNNVSGDPDAGDMVTTGILVFSAVVPTTETVRHNDIDDNQTPIWTSPNVTLH